MTIAMHWHDWLALFGQYMLLSLLSISGAITTVPDMHRYLVAQHGWLTDAQFSSSVAIAQAAPGPNVLFVALMGWNVGLNAGGGIGAGPGAWVLGFFGLLVTMVGIMLPSRSLNCTPISSTPCGVMIESDGPPASSASSTSISRSSSSPRRSSLRSFSRDSRASRLGSASTL